MTDMQNSGMEMEQQEAEPHFPLGDHMLVIEDRETERCVGRFIWAMWLSIALLLSLNSAQLVTYVNGFGAGPVQDAVVSLATGWNEHMQNAGATRLSIYIQEHLEWLRQVSWDDIEAQAEKARAPEAVQFLRGVVGDPALESKG